MLSFSSTLEPLRMANRMSNDTLFEWRLYSPDNLSQNKSAVNASNGIPIQTTHALSETGDLDWLFVVSGIQTNFQNKEVIAKWLHGISKRGVMLGSISTGSVILADAGLLKNKRCTVHWESSESLQESHLDLIVSANLFENSDNVMTCSGGVAGLDMMLHYIANQHSVELAKNIAEQSIYPDIRQAQQTQRMALLERHEVHHPTLLKAIALMQDNLENPLNRDELGQQVGLSSRQLERLFKQYLALPPSLYYLNLRLEKANRLLKSSSLSIQQISTACGFNYTSYFARCYRKKFEETPKQTREQHGVF